MVVGRRCVQAVLDEVVRVQDIGRDRFHDGPDAGAPIADQVGHSLQAGRQEAG